MLETSKPARASRKALRLTWAEAGQRLEARTSPADNGRVVVLRVEPRIADGRWRGWGWDVRTVKEGDTTGYSVGYLGCAPEPLRTQLQAQVAAEAWLAQTLATWSAWVGSPKGGATNGQ